MIENNELGDNAPNLEATTAPVITDQMAEAGAAVLKNYSGEIECMAWWEALELCRGILRAALDDRTCRKA